MSDELDRVLSAEELALTKDKEIERVLNCCQWDYFSILQINPLQDDNLENQIKRTYRRKTLLIHPDKVSNPKAPLAFDRLKKAELVLSFEIPENESATLDERSKSLINEKKRLLAIYEEAEKQILSSKNISIDQASDEHYQQLLLKVSEILNEEIKLDEVERNFQQQQEAKKLAEIKKAQQERELKKKLATQWEDERDVRVNNWRSYTSKIEKPKKRNKAGKHKKKVLA